VIIRETFHWPGKYPVFNILLNMRVIALVSTSGNFFKILPVRRSCPGAFLVQLFCRRSYFSEFEFFD